MFSHGHARRATVLPIVLAAAVLWTAGQGLRAAAIDPAETSATPAGSSDPAVTAESPKATPPPAAVLRKPTNLGQTPKQKRQLAVDRQAAAKKAVAKGFELPALGAATMAPLQTNPQPDYYGIANWANSPLPLSATTANSYALSAADVAPGTGIRKFVDRLPGVPGVTPFGVNNLGQSIPLAIPEEWCSRPEAPQDGTCISADYYEIGLVQTRERMHSDLPPTLLREYVQLSTDGTGNELFNANVDPNLPDTPIPGYFGVTEPHFLGPLIVAAKDRPVRIKFRNLLPAGEAGDLFLPVDTSYVGAGVGPDSTAEPAVPQFPVCSGSPKAPGCFTDNRATLHLHGGASPWISDGTPHQWITPAAEGLGYPKGVSVRNVPDMGNECDAPHSGCQTFYYTNQQSARLMFYHDHAWGITRLNVYAGEAAGYLITDSAEQQLITTGPLKDVGYGIPLVIQDRTFVPDTPQLAATDPLWDLTRWGGKGSLWLPHVYVPIQNPDSTEPNGFGRWFYGPWFWPPITLPAGWGPIPNAYYDAACDPNVTWCQPATVPGTPYVSSGMEAFHDTPIVNGTAYPYVVLEPKAYRFRILNAANDRFFNLQWYVADTTGTEVALNAAEVAAALTDPAGVIPHVDRALSPPGPPWVQIGTEGGFLPAPADIPNQEITYVTDPGRFDVGNVDLHSLLLGSAERADVIVDFSAFAGKTLILYNDAPAAFPARDPRYDLYTGNADQRDVGGSPSTLPGYGPNTRTVMQVRIAAEATSPAVVDRTALNDAFAHHVDESGQPAGVFESSQHPIIVGQAAYNGTYGTNFASTGWCNSPGSTATRCDGFVRIFEQGGDLFGFNSLTNALAKAVDPTVPWAKTSVKLEPKGMHDEPNSSAFDEYGRMQAMLGLEAKGATPLLQNIILYPYPNPPTELIDGTKLPKGTDLKVTPISSGDDGTQVWKITHNGVDTHPIHFHLYDVQLLNRSPWDGQIILPPDPNELGWKDTVRISPLEDTYVALRPVVPQVPFKLPNSIRVLNPMRPQGSILGFNPVDPNGVAAPIYNDPVNFGWEYVWHCHILSHEEMDMMRPQSLAMPPEAPEIVTPFNTTSTSLTLTWNDNSLNETAFVVQRDAGDGQGWVSLATLVSSTPDALGQMSYTDDNNWDPDGTYQYQVVAQNTVGYGGAYPSLTTQSVSNVVSYPEGGTLPSPQASLSPADLAFGDQNLNTTSPPLFVTLTNAAGAGTLGIMGVSTSGDFAQTNDCLSPLLAGATCTITVTFTPTVAGARVGSLIITSNNPTALSVSLTGNGVAAPNAPSLLTAAATGPTSVVLTWQDNSNNETNFRVERRLLSDPNFTALTSLLGANITTFLDTTASDGTAYEYRVFATNSAGDSLPSNTASVTTPLPPPSGLTAAAIGPTTVVLTWQDNSINETNFRVERRLLSDPTFTALLPLLGPNSTTFQDATASEGTAYEYRVFATNPAGDSLPSSTASVTTPLPPPSGLTAAAIGPTTVVLTWQDNSINETNFRVERRLLNGTFTALTTLGPNSTTFQDTTASEGTTYEYRVFATNSAIDSLPSNTASVTTPLAPPSLLMATASGPTTVVLTWQDNSNNEANFRVERRLLSDANFTALTSLLGANSTTFQDTTASEGTTYEYRVFATNSTGESLPSNTASVTTPLAPPSGLMAAMTANPPLGVVLNWTDNSFKETGFTIERATDSTFSAGLTTVSSGVAADSVTYTDFTVTADTTYYYRVRANNGTPSAWSNTAGPITTSTPARPTNLTVTNVTQTAATLNWQDNSNNEAGFTVQIATNNAFSANLRTFTVGPNAATFNVTGLSAKTKYYFRVRAFNSAGTSQWSPTVNITTPR